MSTPPLGKVLVAGGAGFIGSHLVETLLHTGVADAVTVLDDFSSGKRWHLGGVSDDRRLRVIEARLQDLEGLVAAMSGHHTVVHLASNPDIARAVSDPDIDFRDGTLLTRNVLEAARRNRVGLVLYASGSGVYGDRGARAIAEDDGPFEPISTYGASKLAGEALLSAYARMFELRGCAFRFGNVVGPRQTHGVGYDFLRKLRRDPHRLVVLGDGSQSKAYVHVEDIVAAVLLAAETTTASFSVFNVATEDLLTVREIATLAIAARGLAMQSVEVVLGTEPRGWSGDVPVVRLDSARIRALGWRPRRSSREAMTAALQAMDSEIEVHGTTA